MNPEKLNFDSIESENLNDRLEVHFDNKSENFINIEVEELLEIKGDIDSILGTQWNLENQKIDYYSFSDRKSFENFVKNNVPNSDSLLKENAVFYINPKTQAKIVLNYTPIPSEEEISKGESYGYDLNRRKQMTKADILSSFAHETAHMHPFFNNHGNEDTANMWEQEQICVHIGEKARGDISDILLAKGFLSEEKINSFNLKNGGWDNLGENKNIVANYFYPFLIKEYGIEKVRMIWKNLQENPDLEFGLKEILNQEPKDIVNIFKEKIKDKQYLRDIFN
ncbi:MAG: hypothetical protein WCX30_01730 [Candidatus Paceibacterota bacterium]|jgi:hypothetical protein|nr:hypothetical protein [bacterium]